MAIYVHIRKIAESDSKAVFVFGPNENQLGSLHIEKASGVITVTKEVEGDTERNYSSRAARKVSLHWRSGEYPQRTCWAS